jgi:PleD family two-component response regulator
VPIYRQEADENVNRAMTRMNGQPRVLVYDSESQSLRALKVVLRAAGFDVQAKRPAEEALHRAALRTPSVVIVAMLLPDGTGVDLCRQLAAWGSPALIVLCAVDDEEQMVLALGAGRRLRAEAVRAARADCPSPRDSETSQTR